jgi:circadian clock protein KaiC
MAKASALGLDFDRHTHAGDLEIIWNPMSENLLDKLGHQLLQAVKSRKVKRLLIDGLGGFQRAAVYQPRMTEFFSALTNELRALGVTTLATWELPDVVSPTLTVPGSEVSSLADNLIMVRHVEIAARYKKSISILKVRDSAFDPLFHEMTFGNHGIEVVVPLEPVTGAATGTASPLSR